MIRILGSLAPTTFALAPAALAGTLQAQTAVPPPSPFPVVPTIKVLAIGRVTAAMTPDAFKAFMPGEVKDTVRLYLNGKIDQWYVRKDRNGVVFLMNVGTVEEAHELLEALPLGKAKLLEFELIPLGPLSPLNLLLEESVPAGSAVSK